MPSYPRYSLFLTAQFAIGLLAFSSCSTAPESQREKFLKLGARYMQNEKYHEATILYRKAVQVDRKFAPAYHQLAFAQMRLERYDDAAWAFRRAWELDAYDVVAFRELANLYFRALASPDSSRGILANLIDLVEEAESRFADPTPISGVKGRLFLAQGQSLSAVPLLENALKADPGDSDSALALAIAKADTGNAEEAEQAALDGLDRNPANRSLYDFLYMLMLAQGRETDAVAVLERKALNRPENDSALIQLATHHHLRGRKAEKRKALERVLRSRSEFDTTAWARVGDFHLYVGEPVEAMNQYRLGLQQTADYLTYRPRIVGVLIATGARDEAEKELASMMADEKLRGAALGLRAMLRSAANDPLTRRSALEDYRGALGAQPANPYLRYRYAESLIDSGDTLAAVTQLNESLRLKPRFPPATHSKIEIHLSRNEFSQARILATELLDVNPDDMAARLSLARSSVGLREYNSARRELIPLMTANRQTADVMDLLATMSLKEEKFKEAELLFDSLRRTFPKDIRGVTGLFQVYRASGDLERAAEMMKDELWRHPVDVGLLAASARLAITMRNPDLASAHLSRILELRPDHGEAHLRLAEILLKDGKREEGIAHLNEAMAADPPIGFASYRYGTLLLEQQKYREAAEHLRRAIVLEPDLAPALNNLAHTLVKLREDLDLAVGYAERAVARDPGNADYLDTLGLVYLERGMLGESTKLLTKVVEARPDYGESQYYLGLAWYQSGNFDLAREHLIAARQKQLAPATAKRLEQVLRLMGQ